jgi:hypothetical protein
MSYFSLSAVAFVPSRVKPVLDLQDNNGVMRHKRDTGCRLIVVRHIKGKEAQAKNPKHCQCKTSINHFIK